MVDKNPRLKAEDLTQIALDHLQEKEMAAGAICGVKYHHARILDSGVEMPGRWVVEVERPPNSNGEYPYMIIVDEVTMQPRLLTQM